ncbi:MULTISPECIES: sensor histidine kinase [unclassified Streptomyces]|uniref:sensor histidine kinase n=1 Tax=unclassified Streptomyces TaxID=2593676 RepID=UPI000DB9609F|nr:MULTISPECIES: sensor histidine kinase [unclassified Streptomyces]MYT72235.1 sensor histidine kinase [Streptomyces sp. SID8367]RAJ81648.1 signal transduction histidine kinase [Streptomyces sp. PsTaAH-137]
MRGPEEDVAAAEEAGSRWLAAVVHAAFFLLLAVSLARFLLRHPGGARVPWIIALSAVLAVLYVVGVARGNPRRSTSRQRLWLYLVVAVVVVLVVLAPSFAWVGIPLFYTGLRSLPTRAALVLVALLTGIVIASQVRLAGRWDPDLVLGPPVVAVLAAGVFLQMRWQAARQRALIDDLIRTRRELAAAERRAGTLAERERLSMEIHDTLAQGLSSQQMLLQAAERVWASDPGKARTHVRTAASIADHNLTEARRFVHDLAPGDLAHGLEQALRTVAARESGERLTVRVHIDAGERAGVGRLPDRVEAALLRIAQGALANVREHAGASGAAVTLTLLDDQVVLDVADDGCGFDTGADVVPGVRGHGLAAMRARATQLGGTLTLESTPTEGTVLSVSIPLSGG